jgi:sugar lactone lactonase YvrE
MVLNIFFAAALTFLVAGKCDSSKKKITSVKSDGAIWTNTQASEKPECTYFDARSGLVFVSNIAGAPTERNGKGSIYILDQSGKLVSAKWATGLDAPKGMRRLGNQLLVTDIDKVVSYDIKTGKKVREVKIKDAKFLNDIAVHEKTGRIYVSDTIQSAIYLIDGAEVEVFAKGPELEHPNGLLMDGIELVVASWGTELKDDWSVSRNGSLFALNIKSKKRRQITKEPLGNLDGLEKTSQGYLVSDWLNGGVMHVAKTGETLKKWPFPKGSADIGFDSKSSIVFVPEMLENKITALKL